MLVVKNLAELQRVLCDENRLKPEEKTRLTKMVKKFYQPGQTIYIFFSEEKIRSSQFNQSIKDALIEILQRPGEIAAVYHQEDEKTRRNRETLALSYTDTWERPLAKGH